MPSHVSFPAGDVRRFRSACTAGSTITTQGPAESELAHDSAMPTAWLGRLLDGGLSQHGGQNQQRVGGGDDPVPAARVMLIGAVGRSVEHAGIDDDHKTACLPAEAPASSLSTAPRHRRGRSRRYQTMPAAAAWRPPGWTP
jgi:hypothetical protein